MSALKTLSPVSGTPAVAPRGRPLAMLAFVLLAWSFARVATWEAPWPQIETMGVPLLANDTSQSGLPSVDGDLAVASNPAVSAGQWQGLSPPPPFGAARVEGLTPQLVQPNLGMDAQTPYVPMDPATLQGAPAGHQAIWMAAMSHLPVPAFLQQSFVSATLPSEPDTPEQPRQDRWSIDAWAFWRQDSNSALVSQGRAPTYGASQIGAVLNYRLAPSNKRDPRAFVRAYRALIAGGETEVSAGLSARPVAKLPIRLHAELRVTERDGSGNVDLRPSAFATTEIAPVKLPFAARAEIYAQAGYVGGNNATAFADGQLHLLRDVGQFDLAGAENARLSLGAAAWGGAQEGAERVDVGPSVRMDVTIGSVPARLSVDYRERVAGTAEPDSGAAVTLSTRF